MAKDTSIINPAAIHETNDGGAIILDDAAFRNFTRRLRRLGFRRSPCGEAYYHPDHWFSGGDKGFKSPGDTWLFNDAFTARTPDAKAFLQTRHHQ